MERKSFLKTLAGLSFTGLLLKPTNLFATKKETVLFTDVFFRRNKNRRLAGLKKSPYLVKLVQDIKSENIPVYEYHPTFLTEYGIILPLKKEYDPIELRHFFEQVVDACIKRGRLTYHNYDGIMRFYCDEETKTIVPDIFFIDKRHMGYTSKPIALEKKLFTKQEQAKYFA